ncbi:SAM-dependent methyltransferase [Thalassotalea insulae]|uniref:SAM-dependent methyltransferase n=1 Tax=Thalassotalea insulae TaxID=2056778 RepID=A0ABQ6GWZ8_9GAMM|nr:5-histidylcysteine sulfoxide synthase [Thalassotalea insulae]GLX79250.1 SAM-dependent methyltransferase [Thalassotalea insulae]
MKNLIKQQKTPLLTGSSVDEKRQQLKQYFINSWQSYESLFALINADEAFYLRPEPLRHPLIFYYGHTATFYINKLMLGKYISKRLDPALEAICAVGVDEMSWDDLDSRHYDWPSVQTVRDYRQQVFQLIVGMIDTMELSLPIRQDSLAWVFLMGCEHERIHLETSSVIMRMLPLDYLTASEQWLACDEVAQAPENKLLPIAGQKIELGKAESDPTYGWDNEYGQLSVEVKDFNVSQYLVSNQEFLAFVDAGGYQQQQYWTEEGQQWLAYKKSTMPRFWLKINGEYFQRNLLNEIPLPLNWPVEVNYLEAKAFCNWKAKQERKNIRLPTEAEWYCLRQQISEDLVDWHEAPGNINLEFYASSCPVNRFSHQGIYDICGNVWQWTESAIDGFNGFSVHPLYDDFSTPTFDGKHNLIKGGSWISTGNEAIKSSRYAFRRHFYQHAGFRYIESEQQQVPVTAVNCYETDADLCQQLALHYQPYLSKATDAKPENFPQKLAHFVRQVTKQYAPANNKLLNLGCSVGATAFELSPDFAYIDGVDFSARFIQYGVKLQQGESLRYQSVEQGDIVHFNEVNAEQVMADYRSNILFSQGDAVNLKPIFNDYDVIILQQVLEQSYDPKKVLATIKQRLNKQGLLIIASDYVFDPNIADKAKWLGGIKVNGENVTGFDGLIQALADSFILREQQDIPLAFKLNHRQTLAKLLDVTVWQLKDDD